MDCFANKTSNLETVSKLENETLPNQRQPIFNLPAIIPLLLALLFLVHVARVFIIPTELNNEVIIQFAFVPARYIDPEFWTYAPFAPYWTPVTYSLIHADWAHLVMNSFWLLAFGGVTARRLTAWRFVVLFIIGAIAGAAMHYVLHMNDLSPMIGASASVSACMGAAVRLPVFSQAHYHGDVPTMQIRTPLEALRNKQALTFIIIWFGINLLFGTGVIDITGNGNPIAWEAHIGGFLSGFLLFGFIDQLLRSDKA